MDKYEYNLKIEQMKKMIEKKNYTVAAKIADTLDWEKIKNNSLLGTIADVYEINGEYEKARDILEIAYDRTTAGRQLAYKLTVLSAKIGQIADAKLFYKDYVEMAPNNSSRYLLEYEIAKGENAPVEELISILERYLDEDFEEKWLYVLAVLYHKAGMREKCIETCDTLILWFNEGKYVYRGLELKMLYVPLTPEQQEKYELYSGNETQKKMKYSLKHNNQDGVDIHGEEKNIGGDTIVIHKNEDSGEIEESDINEKHNNIEDTDNSGEINIDEIKVKEIDVNSKYNTVNIQAEIAKSMESLLNNDFDEENALKEPTRELSEIDRNIYNKPLRINGFDGQKIEQVNSVFGIAPGSIDPLYQLEGDGQIGISVEEKKKDDDQLEGQLSIEDILAEYEQQKEDGKHDYEEIAITEEDEKKENEAIAEEAAAEEKEAITEEDDIIAEESGLQVRENDMDEEVEIDDLLGIIDQFQGDNIKIEKESETALEVKMEDALVTSPEVNVSFTVDITGIADILAAEKICDKELPALEEVAVNDTNPEQEDDFVLEEDDILDEFIPDEGSVLEATSEEITSEEIASEEAASEETTSEETASEETTSEETTISSKISTEESGMEEMNDENLNSEEVPKEESTETHDSKENKEPKENDLKKQLKNFIVQYGKQTGLDNGIIMIIENLVKNFEKDGSSKTNNVFITGEVRSGKTTMARDVIKLTNQIRHRRNRKIAKTNAMILNKKGIKEALRNLDETDIIIEKAGSLSADSVQGLKEVLEENTGGMLVVLEDEKASKEQMFAKYPELEVMFNNVLGIKEFSLTEWAEYANNYANEAGYDIDEMAMLALHAKLDMIYIRERAVTKEAVETMMNEAMRKADRGVGKFIKNIFGKKDKLKKNIIKEEDFY